MAEDEPLELLVGEDKEITESDQEASVIKFVNQVIWEAFKDRATDIHFEPAEDELRIRYRIDGILHQTPMPPQLKRYQAALISRIKVMSGMNISEKRLPQDGRINVRIKGEEIDIRVSTVPTVYGESVSLRLLTRGKIFLSLDKLGFSPLEEKAIREIIVKPHGIFLVTGPTGSGKSTSLYAFLSTINSVHKRIITIEEPVEYELKGINQIAVRPEIGLTFAMGLRHILRQDPNVIMVGEIRDLETAEIAIRAALTGPLGVQHAAHERRAERLHAPDRHGHRAVPGGLVGRVGHGPAPGAHHLSALQDGAEGRARLPAPDRLSGGRNRDGEVLARRRVRGMPAARLPGAHGHLRIADPERVAAPADLEPRGGFDHRPEGHRARHAHAADRRLEQGPQRPDDH